MKQFLKFSLIALSVLGTVPGHTYAQKQGQDAVDSFLQVLQSSEYINDKNKTALIDQDIADIYKGQNNYPKALEYFHKILRLKEGNGNDKDGKNLGDIGMVHLSIAKDNSGTIKPDSLVPAGKTANLQKAILYLQKAITVCNETRDLADLRIFYAQIAEAYSLSGNYKGAFENYRQSVSINDSLFAIENNKKNTTLAVRHEAELKEKEKKLQRVQSDASQHELEYNNTERTYYIAGLGILLLLLIALFACLTKIRKIKKQLAQQNMPIAPEKENAGVHHVYAGQSEQSDKQLLANISHQIYPPVNSLIALGDLLLDTPLQEQQKVYAEGIKKSSGDLLHIINDLLGHPKLESEETDATQITASIAQVLNNPPEAEQKKEEIIPINYPSGITDLNYLDKFCEGDKERMDRYIGIYLQAAEGLEEQINTALAANDHAAIAALVHSFKPKWMMMGMKQSIELGQKTESLCHEPGHDEQIANYLALLIEQNGLSVKELERRS